MNRYLATAGRAGARLVLTACTLLMAMTVATINPAGASVDIEKATNGEDADTGAGPTVEVGDVVNWTWRVTAGVELYDIVVSDTSGVVPNCDTDGDGTGDGTFIHPGPLEAGQSFVCTGSSRAEEAGRTNLSYGEVQASDFDGSLFRDRDPSHYSVAALPASSTSTTSSVPDVTAETNDQRPRGLSSTSSDSELGSTMTQPSAAADDAADDDADADDAADDEATGVDLSRRSPERTEPTEDLAMAAEPNSSGRSTWPIGLGLTTIGIGLLFIGYRLESLLGIVGARTSADKARLRDPDVLD